LDGRIQAACLAVLRTPPILRGQSASVADSARRWICGVRDTGRFAVRSALHTPAPPKRPTPVHSARGLTRCRVAKNYTTARTAQTTQGFPLSRRKRPPLALRGRPRWCRCYAVGLALFPSKSETPHGWARQRAGVGRLASWLAPRSPFRRTAQRPFRRYRPPPQTMHRATLQHGLLSRRPMQGTTPHPFSPLLRIHCFPHCCHGGCCAPAPPAPWKKEKGVRASRRSG